MWSNVCILCVYLGVCVNMYICVECVYVIFLCMFVYLFVGKNSGTNTALFPQGILNKCVLKGPRKMPYIGHI